MLQLAVLRNYQGRYQEAEQLFTEVLERDKRQPVALNNLACMLARRDGKAKGEYALGLVNQSIEILGPLPSVLDTRGMIYLALGRGGEAVKDLEEAVADAPNPEIYFHLAQAYVLVNDKTRALSALNSGRGLGLKPERLNTLERPAYQELLAQLGEK
jgi:tetratricopeptide (TPR) repeat protein